MNATEIRDRFSGLVPELLDLEATHQVAEFMPAVKVLAPGFTLTTWPGEPEQTRHALTAWVVGESGPRAVALGGFYTARCARLVAADAASAWASLTAEAVR